MKRKILFFPAGCLLAGAMIFSLEKAGWAESLNRLSNHDLYEYSLMNLKKSAAEVAQKNAVLSQKNKELKERLESFNLELEAIRGEKTRLSRRLSSGPEAAAARPLNMDEKIRNSQLQIEQLKQEEDGLEEKVAFHRQIKEETQKQISAAQLEIVELNHKIENLQGLLDNENFGMNRNALGTNIEEHKKENLSLRNKLKQLQSEYDKPVQLIQGLQEQQGELKKILEGNEAQLNTALDQEQNLRQELEVLGQERDAKVKELSEEITSLRARYEEQGDVFSQAQEKLKDRPLDMTLIDKEEQELMENLVVIRQENDTLQREFVSLQEKINQPENQK